MEMPTAYNPIPEVLQEAPKKGLGWAGNLAIIGTTLVAIIFILSFVPPIKDAVIGLFKKDTPLQRLEPVSWEEIVNKPEFVESLNSLTGNLTLSAGENVEISNEGSKEIKVSATASSTIINEGGGSGSSSSNVDLNAGTGISISGSSPIFTITNTNLGSSQKIFKNFAVSAQPTIVSDSNNDTLTFAAGSGITLTTNSGTDTLTIASTGGGDADTFDGLDSIQFLRSDTSDNFTSGTLTFNVGTTLDVLGTFSCTDCVGDAAIPDTITVSNYLPLTGGDLTGSLTLNDDDGVSNDVNLIIGDSNESGNIQIFNGGFAGTLQTASLGLARVWTLPDETGTICITGGTCNSSSLGGLAAGSFLRSDTSDNYTSGTLTFDAGTTLSVAGNLSISDNNIPLTGGSTTLDMNAAATTTLTINNSDVSNVANLSIEGFPSWSGATWDLPSGTTRLTTTATIFAQSGSNFIDINTDDSGSDSFVIRGGSTSTERFKITDAGNVSVGTGTTDTRYGITLNNAITTNACTLAQFAVGNSCSGLKLAPDFSGTGTIYEAGLLIRPTYSGSSAPGLIADLILHAPVDSSSGTAASAIGIYFPGDITSGSANYGIYQNGSASSTALNVLGFKTTIGSTNPPSTSLRVDGDVAVSTSVSGTTSIDVMTITLTNTTSSGTQRGLVITNPSGSNGTDALLELNNNNDSLLTVGAALKITDTGNFNGITFGIDATDSDIGIALAVGSNDVTFNDVTLIDDPNSANAISLNSGDSLTVLNGAICVDNDGNCTSLTAGQVRADSFPTTGGDVAEMYHSNQALLDGDVVVISGSDSIAKSNSDYQSGLIGVISTDPGVILRGNEVYNDKTRTSDPNFYPVALVGRVPVKVSTENGSIESGDPLTSSSTPGVAMKATSSGPIIGKALESYTGSGVAKIMIFVNVGWYVETDLSPTTSLTSIDSKSLSLDSLKTNILFVGDRKISINENGYLNIEGNVEIAGNLDVDKLSTEKINITSSKNIGSATLQAGLKEVVINTDSVTGNSKIFVTPTSSTQGQSLIVSEKRVGQGFVVSLDSPIAVDIKFDWFILN